MVRERYLAVIRRRRYNLRAHRSQEGRNYTSEAMACNTQQTDPLQKNTRMVFEGRWSRWSVGAGLWDPRQVVRYIYPLEWPSAARWTVAGYMTLRDPEEGLVIVVGRAVVDK